MADAVRCACYAGDTGANDGDFGASGWFGSIGRFGEEDFVGEVLEELEDEE